MPAQPATGRFIQLDGLRGIAVLLVILAHYPIQLGPLSIYAGETQAGALGVDIFFVLSGFLITHLLLREEDRNGVISMRNFYARRALRILPPLCLYLGVLALLNFAGAVSVPWPDFVSGLFFVRNYFGASLETGHLWTLAIEEQFYLAMPLSLVLVSRPKTRLLGCLVLVAASVPWRQFVYHLAGGAEHVNNGRTDFRIEPLLWGALLALARSSPVLGRGLASKFLHGAGIALSAVLLIWLSRFSPLALIKGVRAFAPTLSFVAIALLVNWAVAGRNTLPQALLALRPLVWVGRLSYSLYLWQQLFAPMLPGWGQWRQFPQNLLLALGMACLSYYTVEQPLMALRERLRHSAGSRKSRAQDALDGQNATRGADQ